MAFDQDRVAQIFKKLNRQLAKLPAKPQANNVHQFRTAARRVETVLGVLIPDPDRKQRKLSKLVTRLRRRAGKVRDLDVQVAALRSLKVSEQPALKTQLLETMSQMRAKRERRLLDMLDKETVRELRRRLTRASERFPERAPDPWGLAADMLTTFTAQNGPVNETLLHRYRIEGKRIRYVAELAADNPEAQRSIEELKRMQDALGEWHDWLTLNATVTKLLPESVNSPLLPAIRNISRAKYRDAVQAVANAKAALSKKPVAQEAPSYPPNPVVAPPMVVPSTTSARAVA